MFLPHLQAMIRVNLIIFPTQIDDHLLHVPEMLRSATVGNATTVLLCLQ